MGAQSGINRRSFFKRTSAIGGGMLLLGMTKETFSNPVIEDIPLGWKNPWYPEVPNRLSGTTRQLAKIALSGEHGRSMVKADFSMAEEQGAESITDSRYAQVCMAVAKNAPLRIIPGEKIVGSATYVEATRHLVPGLGISSVSHVTIGFHKALHLGYKAYRSKINERISRNDLEEAQIQFLKSMITCLDAAKVWQDRNIAQLEALESSAVGAEKEELQTIIKTLKNVPENAPQNFREAVQSLWSMYAFQRLMGNWSGIGRIDEMLGSYLKKDLESGILTIDEAREILAHFWIKGCEWIGCDNSHQGTSGDAQFYQNVILAGVNAEGNEVCNEVTYLVLDIIEELHISDFPVAVRLNKNTPEKLYRRIAEVQRFGGGIVSTYNEDVVIEGLVKFGYPLEEARTFTNDGCWEVIIPGKSAFSYSPQDALQMLHTTLGLNEAATGTIDYKNFEEMYNAYINVMSSWYSDVHDWIDTLYNDGSPAPLLSIFVEDCIEKGLGYYNKGAKYNVKAPHAGGLQDVANSLLVIRKLVYEDQFISLREFIEILRNDWEGNEALRKMVLNRLTFYGNDKDEADQMLVRVFNDYTEVVGELKERNGIKRPVGISSFGRELEWLPKRKASPSGAKSESVLATNFSPTPGTDKQGPTAAIKSYCKMDFTKTPNGATLELKLLPDSVKGENGVEAIVGLMKSFKQLGGFYLHIDVVDSAMLLDAQRNPEKYPNLPVRIAGWSARFTTLNKKWQDMIINRTQQLV